MRFHDMCSQVVMLPQLTVHREHTSANYDDSMIVMIDNILLIVHRSSDSD